jgi:hypothetical protein
MIKLLLAASLLSSAAMANAEAFLETRNTGGGKIVLTSDACAKFGQIAYATHPSSETQFGCWIHDNAGVHILWDANKKVRSYDYSGWHIIGTSKPDVSPEL